MTARTGFRPSRSPLALISLLVSLACLSVTLVGCSTNGQGRPTVVVTTNILGDITRNIVGDEADVTVLMKANADPHSFGISAPQAAAIEQADLVVYNGLGLEENVLRHVEAARESGVPTLAVGDSVAPITYVAGESADEPDPHFWTDPKRVSDAVELIAEDLIEHVKGADRSAIERNASAYGAKVSELTRWMRERFDAIPAESRQLVTNHHVFGYLAQRFDFRVVGAVIPSGTTLASPSASDLKSLAGAIEKANVKAIFADSSQPDRLAHVLKNESGIDVRVMKLFSESLTAEGKGAATYLEMMRANTTAIAEGLNPR
ncbi:zinc ABC transporter substrate-binding protein AztC [Streptomyces sp. PTY087I2]|uniref:zinc ABC transporter substrate-binding protein AztC n=1 Tax=Streptomyces sp. PTY087I2 TaxID=1819298 RepID=UPI00080B4CFB|nr:zinc ABC transporter substrate-binding protein AztC [Streptomyces sp. PTY087I2]OCC14017.1 Manganese ABC transporter substrate-binding lipoprotein precursor [Streptomyces sp. PTY087I2]